MTLGNFLKNWPKGRLWPKVAVNHSRERLLFLPRCLTAMLGLPPPEFDQLMSVDE